MQMVYPDWLRAIVRGKEHMFCRDEPVFIATSGGQTSGLLAKLTQWHSKDSAELRFNFENTGREHSQTYLFLQRLEQSGGVPMKWTEFRKPLQKGAPPRECRFEEVNAHTAHRNGEPFRWMLETLSEYRAAMGKVPEKISGGPMMRLCSSYLKTKQADKVAATLWGDDTDYTCFIGFRGDEPHRVG